jgi:hypothetical protein
MDIKDDVITAQRLKYKMLRPVSTDARAIPVTSFGDGDRCDPNVCAPIQDQKGKCVEVIGGYGCKEERDDACGARAVARESNRDVDFAVKDDALYSMKWYVLEESTNGRSIVDKYYQAGITIRNNITRIDVVKAYGFITTMESKVRKIMADTESKDILFDSITRDEAIAFLDEIKNLDGSRLWSENVAWLRGLLTKYANKSVKEVFVYLNS